MRLSTRATACATSHGTFDRQLSKDAISRQTWTGTSRLGTLPLSLNGWLAIHSVRWSELLSTLRLLTVPPVEGQDKAYRDVFLKTFTSFTTSEAVFASLQQQYNMTPPSFLDESQLQRWDEQRGQVQLRCVCVREHLLYIMLTGLFAECWKLYEAGWRIIICSRRMPRWPHACRNSCHRFALLLRQLLRHGKSFCPWND